MTTTFTMTAADIINQCLLQQQWLDYKQTVDTTKQGQMLTSLQALIKRMGVDGLKVWTEEQTAFTFVPGQRRYSVGPAGADITTDRPLRIDFALIRPNNGGSDIPLNALARQDYLMLGNKTQPGTPNSYFYDPKLTNGYVYFYLNPDAFNAGAYTCYFYSRTQIQDVSTITANMPFPQEWYNPLIWLLADDTSLMNKCATEVIQKIERNAANALKMANDWDREYAPVEFGLDLSPGVYGNE